MGEHKRNPIAIAAKKGELPPKKPGMSKRQHEALIQAMLYQKLGLAYIYDAMKGGGG